MQLEDVYELAHQAIFGSAHAVPDRARAERGNAPAEQLRDPSFGSFVSPHRAPAQKASAAPVSTVDAPHGV